MKKGFTLIELLAVIIILAVIALIATPVVLNVVENATNEARKNSVRGYADSVRLSYAEEILKNTGKPLKELATLKTQGQEVDCEYVKYDDKKSGTLLHSCKVDAKGNYCYINGYVYEDGTVECNNIINLIMSDGIPYNTPNIYVVSQIPDGLEYAQSKEISVEYPSLKVVEEKYFIKSSESIEINAIGKCGSEETPFECTEENVSSIEANTWYQVSGNVTFTINKNISIEAIIGNNNEYGSKKTYEINNIDTTEPSVSIEGTSTTSNKIIVNAKCEDLESNISKYEYTIDGTNYQESNVFNNLSSTNKYKVKVRCTNGSGMSKEIESEEISLNEIIKPTIEQVSQTPSDSEYAQSTVIRITYNSTNVENPKYYYSLDNETWIEVSETTKDIEFTSNGNLYAKTVDETGNTANAATFTVANIDTAVPTVSTSVSGATATMTLSDNMQLAGYTVTTSTTTPTSWTSVTGTSATQTWTASVAGTYYAWVKDASGRTAYKAFSIEATAFGSTVTYVSNGTRYTETIPNGSSVLSPKTFTPSKSGASFVGWSNNSTSTTKLTSLNANGSSMTLYAIFKYTDVSPTLSKSVLEGNVVYSSSFDATLYSGIDMSKYSAVQVYVNANTTVYHRGGYWNIYLKSGGASKLIANPSCNWMDPATCTSGTFSNTVTLTFTSSSGTTSLYTEGNSSGTPGEGSIKLSNFKLIGRTVVG